MGAGASAGVAVAAKAASAEELRAALGSLPADARAKLDAALNGWALEYCVCGMLDCKDVPQCTELVLADAKLQVVEEPRAPRMAVFGVPGAATEGNPTPPEELTKKLYWLASFDCQDAYMTDHKDRESNKAFAKKFMATFAHFPEDPSDMKAVMAAGAQDMAGSYMGPMYHLERAGASVDGTTYTAWCRARAKDAGAARRLVELLLANGPRQLEAEEGALRCTVVPPAAVGVPGVGASDFPGDKDDVTVVWIEAYRAAADYEAHKKSPQLAEAWPKIQALVGDPAADIVVLEFAEAKHFAKP